MKLLSIMVIVVVLVKIINGLFIRSNDVYKLVIDNIQKYYQCDYIFIFSASSKNQTAFDVMITTRLLELQLYFSKNFIYANIIDITKFTDQQSLKMKIIENYSRKSLFVFLNNFDEEKSFFHDLLAPSLDISTPKWLFFFNNETTIDEFFINTYIPFDTDCLVSITDSKNHEVITEIYQTNQYGELKKDIFALWNMDSGIQLPQTYIHQRRRNLFGYHFRASTLPNRPYISVIETNDHKIKIDGIMGKIMEHLKEELNFTITYRLTKGYGNRLDNGSWTGGIADLMNNVSDILASNLAMTSLRREVIDFTIPVFFSDDRFFFKKPIKDQVEWNEFLQPFGIDIWIIIICLIIVTSSIVTLILLFYQRENKQILIKNRESCSLLDNMFVIYGAFCEQAIPPSSINSVFIVHITLHLTATIILAAYSATLISTLAVHEFKLPFENLQDFYQDGTYKMGFLKSSVYNDIFRTSNDSLMNKIYKFAMKHDVMTSTISEGIDRLCNEKNYAYMAPKYLGHIFHAKNCTLIASKTIMSLSMSIGLKQQFPFRELFNYHIARMQEHGILNRIIESAIKIPSESIKEPWDPVQIIDIAPLLVLLIINTLLGFIILWIEKKVYKKFKEEKLFHISRISVQHITNVSRKKQQLLLLKI